MKRETYHGNWQIRIAGILLCLVLITTYMMTGLYARYTYSESMEDSARVARFDISEDGAYFSETLLLETVPGVVERDIEVINKSEVAVSYKVKVENTTQNIPYTFSVNGGTQSLDICEETCYLQPNSTAKVTITATWDEAEALKYMGMVDLIKLTIHAEQVD